MESSNIIREWKKAFPEIDELRVQLVLIRNGYLPEENSKPIIDMLSKRHNEKNGGLFDIEKRSVGIQDFSIFYRPKSLRYLGNNLHRNHLMMKK